jgi:hypothetical protein
LSKQFIANLLKLRGRTCVLLASRYNTNINHLLRWSVHFTLSAEDPPASGTELDPEKWKPVFRKDHAAPKI